MVVVSWVSLTPAEEFAGKVVGVSDGDTITVLQNRTPIKVRLHGIDCPEIGQDFGSRAKAFTSELVFGQVVKVVPRDTDRYGRTVADVILADGRILNHELVRAGLAWRYRKYAPNIGTLAELEAGREKRNAACGRNRTRCRPGSGVGRSERPLKLSWRGNSSRTVEVTSTTPRAAGTRRRFRLRIAWCSSRLKPRRERATDRGMTVIRERWRGDERVSGRRGGLSHRCVP